MNILFVVPPNISDEYYFHPDFNESYSMKLDENNNEIRVGDVRTDMPLGVLSISAYIKKYYSDLNIKLLDFNIVLNQCKKITFGSFEKLFEEELIKYKEFEPDIIGISTLFAPQYHNMLLLGKVCRIIFPKNTFLTAGGGVPSNLYEIIYNTSSDFDALSYGEGELPWKDLIESNDYFSFVEQDDSWITYNKVKRGKRSYQNKCIEQLDDIPFLDYSLCNVWEYSLNPAAVSHSASGKSLPNFHVMTSRGCPNKCCFCSSHSIHGRSMRYYSLERVRQDWLRLKEQFNAEWIVVQDDHLMADKERAYAVIDIIKDLGLKAIFQNGLALYALDYPFLQALKNAGVDSLTLSIESGSFRVLNKIMHKPLSLDIIRRVTEDCRKLGFYTNANIMIGLPGETKQDINEAVQFLSSLDVDWFMVFSATPLAGSEMFEICKEKNYIKEEDYMRCNFKKPIINTEDFTAEYILQKTYEMNLELNFIYNTDIRLGSYNTAITKFNQVLRAKKDHALALFMLSICYERLNQEEKARAYMEETISVISKDDEQMKYFKKYRNQLEKLGSKVSGNIFEIMGS